MVEMVFHQIAGDAAKSLLHGGDLGDDFRAIAVTLDHFLQATHLALDTAKAVEIGCFQVRVNSSGLFAMG